MLCCHIPASLWISSLILLLVSLNLKLVPSYKWLMVLTEVSGDQVLQGEAQHISKKERTYIQV